jgi:site-specific DNA recombinase
MTRVALYARYSSDNQREASIEDQFRICREQAKRARWKIVGTYKDAGISGASMILRPGIQSLLQDAQAGQFDVVLAEALDRISRDQADVATFYKYLKFAGVPIVTLSECEISELHVGLKGTINPLVLKDLAAKTHRGIRAFSLAPTRFEGITKLSQNKPPSACQGVITALSAFEEGIAIAEEVRK